jgi:hypothetical protein
MHSLVRWGSPFVLVLLCVATVRSSGADDPPKAPDTVIMADHAREHLNQKCTVELTVKLSKNAVPRKVYYLDSEEDFHDEKNLAIVISYEHAARFLEVGIQDPAEHYKGKTIRVTGTVIQESEQTRIHVEDPKQITIVKPETKAK